MREEGCSGGRRGQPGQGMKEKSHSPDKPKERAQLSISGILDEILGEKKDTG